MEPRWLEAYVSMMRRLEAEESLLAAQVVFLPHYQKQRDRKSVLDKWEKEAKRGATVHGKQYDSKGREIAETVDDFNAWLRSFGVI